MTNQPIKEMTDRELRDAIRELRKQYRKEKSDPKAMDLLIRHDLLMGELQERSWRRELKNRLENCDGMEPFQVLMSIALMMDQDADEVLENEHFISLMRASQSNPTETLEILRNLVELDNQISECDDSE